MQRPKTQETLARNLRHLMNLREWTEQDVADHSGVSQKTVNNCLNKNYKSKVETVDQIASAFGLDGWHLILPNLVQDLESGGRLAKLITDWSDSSNDGRDAIQGLAARESKFNKKAG